VLVVSVSIFAVVVGAVLVIVSIASLSGFDAVAALAVSVSVFAVNFNAGLSGFVLLNIVSVISLFAAAAIVIVIDAELALLKTESGEFPVASGAEFIVVVVVVVVAAVVVVPEGIQF
jgi:hypothetical protein